jgi:hypothetical protein
MFLLGEGERFCERQEGATLKGENCRKERDCIKVICHPTSATVCKRNQKVDKRGWFPFFRFGLGVTCQKGTATSTN